MALTAPLVLENAPHSCSSRHSFDSAAEDLASSVSFVGPSHVGSLSLSGVMSNLVLAVLGAGQLTLPYAMSQLGLGFGILALLGFTLLAVHSLHTLSIYELHFTPGPTDCLESYCELLVRVWRPGWKLCGVLLTIYAWGGAVSFMIILKGELAFLISFLPSLDGFVKLLLPALPSFINESGSFLLIMITLVIILPLSSFQDLSALKRCAPLGCIAALLITCVVTICAVFPMSHSPLFCRLKENDSLRWWPASMTDVAAALPLLSFALNSSWAFIPILCTMRDKTESRVMKLITGSNAVIVTSYVILAVSGYGMFCNSIKPNILESLGDLYFAQDSDSSGRFPDTYQGVAVLFARFSLAVQLSLALPMRFFVARKTITGDAPSSSYRLMISAALVISAIMFAIMHISLATVLGIVSSICASMLIYILPSIVDLHFRLPGNLRIFASLSSLLIGVFILTAGLLANLLGVAVPGG